MERKMANQKVLFLAAAVATLMMPACDQPEPAQEPPTTAAPGNAATAGAEGRREGETAQLQQRVAELERRWSELEGRAAADSAPTTVAMRAEVREDVTNARLAVEDLEATTPENWWERHERALEQTADDIQADVSRLTGREAAAPAGSQELQTSTQTAPFETRRDQFVTRMQSRLEVMSNALQNVSASGAHATELTDTQARLSKLREDVERLQGASTADWWDISSTRVGEYVARVEDSIRRLEESRS